jgi:hypothetical protein
MQVPVNKIMPFILIIAFSTAACRKLNLFGGEDDKLIIQNNSNLRIYIYPQVNYPDTTINPYNPSVNENYEVFPHTEKRIIQHSWDQVVTMSPSDTLMMFIYDANMIDSTSWDTVIYNYITLMRYDLSLEDLQGMNWKITYP